MNARTSGKNASRIMAFSAVKLFRMFRGGKLVSYHEEVRLGIEELVAQIIGL